MIIYSITNKINGKKYIGQTTRSIAIRWRLHVYRAMKGLLNSPLHRAIRKYGDKSFLVEIMAKAENAEELNKLEVQFISTLKTLTPHGYNISKGGRREFTDYQRQLVSQGIKKSTKVKISREKQKGEGHPGHKLTWEDVRNIRSDFFHLKVSSFDLASKFKVTPENITSIVRGDTWKDIEWKPLRKDIDLAILEHRKINAKRGEDHPNSKLTKDIVKQIRACYLSGEFTVKQLSERFIINSSTIKLILKNKSWFDPNWVCSKSLVELQAKRNRKLPKPKCLKLTTSIAAIMRNLRYVNGLSYKRISELTKISEATVKKFFGGQHPYYPDEGTNAVRVDARLRNPIQL
jgi:group I intron endonuclease